MIVLNFNAWSLTSTAVESVLRSRYNNLELIVVDNCSQDDSVSQLRSRFGDKIRLIVNPSNYGYCRGNNVGFMESAGDYLVFLNNDVLVHPGWLAALVSTIESESRIAAVECNVQHIGFKNLLKISHDVDALGEGGFPTVRQWAHPRPTFIPSGSASIFRRSVLERIGVFDEDFFIWSEDFDLGWRIWLSGYKIVDCPSSLVFHAGSVSTSGKSWLSRKLYLVIRNSIITMIKNYSLSHVIMYVPIRLSLEVPITLGHALRYREPGYVPLRFRSVLLALFWIVRNLPRIMRKRSVLQSFRERDDEEIFKLMDSYPRKLKWISNRVMPSY